MQIKNLTLTNYRNYDKLELAFNPNINIFIGNNAAGKTNILESIYLLALAKSYKNKDIELIKENQDFSKIQATTITQDKEKNFLIILSKIGKKVIINNNEIEKLSDYVGNINTILFSPEDLLIFKNGPQERRKLIDLFLGQISKEYLYNLNNYKKELKYRNDYLKYIEQKIEDLNNINDDMLDVATERLIEENTKIIDQRKSFIKRLEEKTNHFYEKISGKKEKIRIDYINNFENNLDYFKSKYKSDILLGSTGYGIHRDDLIFYKNDESFESRASQGEQRTLCLAIKIAFVEITKEEKGEYPILLLDDVFSELDKTRQNLLLSIINNKMQVFITTTDLFNVSKEATKNAKIYIIKGNKAREYIAPKEKYYGTK